MSRKTGGDAPNNLITLCETCHKACHAGRIKLKVGRGTSFRAEAFMSIMRWTLLDRVRKAHPGLPVENTYGYLTKNTLRLFDKVRCLGQTGFIFGRRSSGYFDVRRLDGVKLSSGISYRKLTLLEKRSTYLTELRNEDGASSPV